MRLFPQEQEEERAEAPGSLADTGGGRPEEERARKESASKRNNPANGARARRRQWNRRSPGQASEFEPLSGTLWEDLQPVFGGDRRLCFSFFLESQLGSKQPSAQTRPSQLPTEAAGDKERRTYFC